MGPPSRYLIEEVKTALARDPEVAELGVEVELVGNDVYLRGTVATEQRREAAGRIAIDRCPGRKVHNEIEVEELRDPGAVENLT